MRIVSEWKDYDLEMKRLQNKIDGNQTEEKITSKPDLSTTKKSGED